jgi:hypothetical protein
VHDFPDETVRVTTLELFFDLVFVFTITQLTTVLVRHPTWRGLLQVLLMLGVIWWMYGGYAWLTKCSTPTSIRARSRAATCSTCYRCKRAPGCCTSIWAPRSRKSGSRARGAAIGVAL